MNRELFKKELLSLVRQHPKKPSYYVDKIIYERGHTPLRLPPFCCDLNPIELIWSQVKTKIKSNNYQKLSNDQFIHLSQTKFDEITPDDWKASIRHVTREFEAKYWQKYNISQLSTLMHHNYTPFIVN